MATADEDQAAVASDAADGTSYAFVYGTLMAPEVFFTVCFRLAQPPPALVREYVFRNAVLPGYTRHRVRYQEYPGIVPDDAEGASVRGILIGGVTPANQHHLDVFEGSEYERRTVDVVLDEDTSNGQTTETTETTEKTEKTENTKQKKTVKAQVYVYKYPDGLERREWDFDEFRREKMHKWARADYTFEGCDPNDPATVAA
ncbi:disease resistance protein [Sporothrix brasiliensis 5110]|uniref:Putative gamma-glutamylcyclotransferase n=1 Tax=Sporothrix brasiliensis 5110 TaxID=1398154 RepID=A0A0C2F5I3_9PEZI|nr:disease resistance protein [Sporothrix brasiliensis 5110]KIH94144.1 disease resistance protein [Sporothrix brasiliensis 5110]